ncbi:TonB-dependent receptor [Parahaliea mediterranea]|uniref:TonB-dependent receptor n=1 Tax=Parahaliea mediterranea TaxID=651086 RepID=UPI0014732844|nr:TonB-dependent receptor [Parahaliea mediterranea]
MTPTSTPTLTPTPPFARKAALAAALLLSQQTASALAQAALEEVIVTAQKRAQSAQDVPVALTAVNAEAIEAMGLQEFSDVTRLSPSLTMSSGNNKQQTSIRIRGIGTNVYSIAVEPSVAVIIDNVSQVQPGQALSNLVDVERIEVLRGPQSTLFGKNASAGLVSVVTKNPASEFEGSLELVVTDDDQQRTVGTLSGPVGGSAGYRVMAYYDDRDGYLDNLTTGTTLNGGLSRGGRGKFLWDITDRLTATAIINYSEDTVDCCGINWYQLDPTARVLGFVPADPAPGIKPGPDNRKIRQDNPSYGHSEDIAGSLQLAYSLGEFSLTSITALDRWDFTNTEDVDFSDVDVAGALTGGALHGGIDSLSDVEMSFFSQELRLDSPLYDDFDYMLGLYYAKADTDRSFERTVLVADWAAEAGTESMAAFGQGNWRFSDKTSLSLGLRYNYEEISVDFYDAPTDARYQGDDTDGVWLGKLSLQHFLNEDTMLFASYSRGYKGQAYDVSTGFNQDKADNPVAAENANAYELGIKTTLFDQRLQFNAVAFYTEYDDYQAQNTQINEDGAVELDISNVGVLETQGIEVDAVGLLGQNFMLRAGFAWIDATVKEYPNAQCYSGQTVAQGCVEIAPGASVQDLAGADLANSPDYKLTLSGEYTLPLGSLPFDGFANVSYRWQDEVNFNLNQDPQTAYDSYDVLDLSVGIVEREREAYRVTLFVNNLLDDGYVQSLANLGNLYGGKQAIGQVLSRDSQRYAGVRVKFNF